MDRKSRPLCPERVKSWHRKCSRRSSRVRCSLMAAVIELVLHLRVSAGAPEACCAGWRPVQWDVSSLLLRFTDSNYQDPRFQSCWVVVFSNGKGAKTFWGLPVAPSLSALIVLPRQSCWPKIKVLGKHWATLGSYQSPMTCYTLMETELPR